MYYSFRCYVGPLSSDLKHEHKYDRYGYDHEQVSELRTFNRICHCN